MVKLVQLKKNSTQGFSLKETWVSGFNIISVEEDEKMAEFFRVNQNQFPEGLSVNTVFSKIRLLGVGAATDYLQVIGTPESIADKL